MAKATSIVLITLLIMAVYSTGITMIVHALPADAKVYVNSFSQPSDSFNFSQLTTDTEVAYSNVRSKIPLVDVGSLVFYSGNFLVDFLGNFLLSIPQMLTLLISSLTLFGIQIDAVLLATIQLLISVLVGAMFLIAITIFLLDLRSGRQIAT